MIGSRLGPYEIIEELGKGGMATVYRAFHPAMERFVAVKVIHRSIASDEQGMERFRREARLIARLEHPYLLPVYDYSPDTDPPYIVMRYLEGGTLKEIQESREVLPLKEIAYLMRQIAGALDYAHRQGIIHRDIKPSNIMIDEDGNAYVADFGIARVNDAQGMTQTGFTVGTPGYMSPEQGMGLGNIDNTADIYSLGVMVFEMATGQPPFRAETPMQVLLQHIQDPVPAAGDVMEGLPVELDAILRKAMAKQPAERYQTAGEFAEAISKVAGGANSSASTDLRTAAVKAIDNMREKRSSNEDDIKTMMQSFEQSRSASQSKVATLPDTPTTATPAAPQPGAVSVTATIATDGGDGRSRTPLFIGAGVILAVMIVAAVLLGGGGGISDAEATQTEVAAIAALATDTEEPTHTPRVVATDTNTPRPTREPATPIVPIIEARRNLDIRIGPGPQFPVIETLEEGEELEVLGVNESGRWYQVLLPDGSRGWVLVSVTTVNILGSTEGIEVAEAPSLTPTDTPTPTYTATDTPTSTNTPTATSTPSSTPSNTPTPTDTPVPTDTPTPTDTPVPTDTPTDVPTPTDTPEPTATYTETPTYTPTDTPTSTSTPTATSTPTSTPTDTATPLPSSTPLPSPTPVPPGRLPFVLDFEDNDALSGSDYDPSQWQVVNEGGQSLLIAQARLTEPLVILGRQVPEWVESGTSDFVINFRFNLDANEGARLVFRFNEGVGYNALEMSPGRLFLKRSTSGANPLTDRAQELILQQVSAPIQLGQWNEVTVWVEGARIYVYLNKDLVMQREDLNTPQLSSGQILLQANNAFRPVRFDDIIIQRAEPGSDHFESASLPGTWQRSSSTSVTVERESDGNQYVRIDKNSEVAPITPPLSDVELRCRIWSEEGGYNFVLRENVGGALVFRAEGGNIDIERIDGAGSVVYRTDIDNFYTRRLWQDVHILLIGDRLEVYLDGQLELEEIISDLPSGGDIRFYADSTDIFRLDDCLITQSATATNLGATFAYDLQNQVANRDFRLLRSDLDETFNDELRTDVWWEDGIRAPGDYLADPASSDHQFFLRMVHQGVPTFRLFRDNVGVSMFGAGTDSRNFNDSTDLLVTTEMRFLENTAGIAWLGLRSTRSLAGNDVYGYRLALVRDFDGSTRVIVDYRDATRQTTFYDDAMPGGDTDLPEWIPITAISYQDKLAFFVNNRFVTSIENATKLGGSLSLGVEANTTADFDTLIIRDTTPHGGQ